MAKIAIQTIVISVQKLVADDAPDEIMILDQKTANDVCAVITELAQDASVIVEATIE